MWKSVLVGALLAIVLVVAASVGGYLYVRAAGGTADAQQQDRVVLIFESPAEDGATVAALVSVVAGDRMQDVSPDSTVTIEGTSRSKLSDAFVYGGGRAVVRALGTPENGGPTAYVAVPEAVWRAALEGTTSVKVTVPERVTVFDGSTLIAIPSGEQTLTASVAATLLRSLPYMGEQGRAKLRRELDSRLAKALVAASRGIEQIDTDLSDETLELWVENHLVTATARPVE